MQECLKRNKSGIKIELFAKKKLIDSDIEVYHYIGSRIAYDINNDFFNLMTLATDKYNNFSTTKEVKNQISHWLLSTKIKLSSVLSSSDKQKSKPI